MTNTGLINRTIRIMDTYNKMLEMYFPEYYIKILENKMDRLFNELDKRGLWNEFAEAALLC